MNIDNIEREFRKQLEDHQSFDLDADYTWRAIEKELDEEREKKGGVFFFLLGISGLLGLLCIGLGLVNGRPIVDREAGIHYEPVHASIPLATDQERTERLTDRTQAKDRSPQKEVINYELSFNQVTSYSQQEMYAITGSKFDEHLGEERSEYLDRDRNIDHQDVLLVGKAAADEGPVSDTRRFKAIVNQESGTHFVVPKIESPLTYLPRKELTYAFGEAVYLAPFGKEKPQLWVEVAGGLFQATNGISTKEVFDYARLRKQSETPQLSWSLGANLYRTKPKGLTFGIGLMYQKTWVRFRYEEERIDSLLLEDIPIHFLINSQTQDTVAVQNSNVTVQQTNTRDVQHFNLFQALNLPLHLGYIKPTKGKLTYGFLASLGFQYYFRQSGRLLSEDVAVIDFSEDSFFRRFGLNATLRPVLRWKTGEHWQVSCSPFASYSLLDRMKKGARITQRPLAFGVGLSISRDL